VFHHSGIPTISVNMMTASWRASDTIRLFRIRNILIFIQEDKCSVRSKNANTIYANGFVVFIEVWKRVLCW
jgi:hypothetical protein